MNKRLTIWTDVRFGGDEQLLEMLSRGIGNHTLVRGDDTLSEADAAFGQPPVAALLRTEKLQWIHISSAGYTPYDRPEVWAWLKARKVAFTNSSSVFDEACAEHLLAMMLGLCRDLPQAVARQQSTHAWSEGGVRGRTRLLAGQHAILFGYGAIARRLAELLSPFRMEVVGVRRQIRGDETIPVVTPAQADDMLTDFQHVVNILPANDETTGFFNAQRFAHMKKGAWFYNIGRGATVVQSALIEALKSGHLGAAYLDVTTLEPLPVDDPLWTAPNCWITPHIGGGYAGEQEKNVNHFLENLRRFERGEALRNRVA